MHSGDLSKLPNPFAPETSSWNRARLVSGLKMLAVVVVALAILMALTSRGPTWLANRLSHGFESLDSTEKQSRLVQLSQLGVAGLEPMMVGLADEDPEVADHAMKLIRDLQTQWTTLPRSKSHQLQTALVDAVAKHGASFSETQRAWAANLLNQSIIENVDENNSSSQEVFSAANNALQQLTVRGAQGDSPQHRFARTDQPSEERREQTISLKPAPTPRHLAHETTTREAATREATTREATTRQRVEPLPLRVSDVESSWTDWPPQEPKILQAGFHSEPTATQPNAVAQASLSIPTMPEPTMPDVQDVVAAESPIVMAGDVETIGEAEPDPSPVDWESIDTASIVKVLGSNQSEIREQAAEQLLSRGFNKTELSVANAIANSDAAYRMELIRQLTTQQTIDARPWLLLLLRDENREVKLEAVSALGRLLDPQIRKELRLRMIDETDQKVVLRIRNTLQLSCLP